MSLLTVLSTT